MRSRLAIALLSATLIGGCGQKSATPTSPSVSAETSAQATAQLSQNPDLRDSATPAAATDFCRMRQQGPADLIAFLDTAERCDGLTETRAREQARCGALGADEIRLRARYKSQVEIVQVLDQARSRPWPACEAAPQPAATEDAAQDDVAAQPENTNEGDGDQSDQ